MIDAPPRRPSYPATAPPSYPFRAAQIFPWESGLASLINLNPARSFLKNPDYSCSSTASALPRSTTRVVPRLWPCLCRLVSKVAPFSPLSRVKRRAVEPSSLARALLPSWPSRRTFPLYNAGTGERNQTLILLNQTQSMCGSLSLPPGALWRIPPIPPAAH